MPVGDIHPKHWERTRSPNSMLSYLDDEKPGYPWSPVIQETRCLDNSKLPTMVGIYARAGQILGRPRLERLEPEPCLATILD